MTKAPGGDISVKVGGIRVVLERDVNYALRVEPRAAGAGAADARRRARAATRATYYVTVRGVPAPAPFVPPRGALRRRLRARCGRPRRHTEAHLPPQASADSARATARGAGGAGAAAGTRRPARAAAAGEFP